MHLLEVLPQQVWKPETPLCLVRTRAQYNRDEGITYVLRTTLNPAIQLSRLYDGLTIALYV